MIQTSITFDGQTSFGTRKTFETKFAKVVNGMGAQATQLIEGEMNATLNTFPAPVFRPIQWKSEKQRRAFFATDGFGGGIPTRRTGKVLSWVLVWDKETQSVKLYNPIEYSKFVFGGFGVRQYQQPFHRNTGYPLAIKVRDRLFAQAETYLANVFAETLEAFGAFTAQVSNGGTPK